MPGRCCDSWIASSGHLWGAAICHNAPGQPKDRLVSTGWGSCQKMLGTGVWEGGWWGKWEGVGGVEQHTSAGHHYTT